MTDVCEHTQLLERYVATSELKFAIIEEHRLRVAQEKLTPELKERYEFLSDIQTDVLRKISRHPEWFPESGKDSKDLKPNPRYASLNCPVKGSKCIYTISYYDSFDGVWAHDVDGHFNVLKSAKKRCDAMMRKLNKGNIQCGEHYSVFERSGENIKEVYRPSLVR